MNLRTVLIISAVTTIFLMVILYLQGAPLKIEKLTPRGIIDLELARTVTRATDIYNAWSPDLTKRAIKNTLIDFLFLTSYGTFLYAACRAVSKFYKPFLWSKIGKSLSVLMIVAAIFDATENMLMLRTLYGHFNKEIAASTFIFAVIKFLLAIVGLAYIIISVIAKLFYQRKKVVQIPDLSK